MKNQRIPNKLIYEYILTLILAFAILWIIYVGTNYSPYRLYLK